MSQIVSMKNMWKTFDGLHDINIPNWIKTHSKEGQDIIIGTDSQQVGNQFTEFATVIVIERSISSNRAVVAQRKWRVPRINQLRQRLLEETLASIETAIEITKPEDFTEEDITNDNIIGFGGPCEGRQIKIHIDANQNIEFKSASWSQQLVGLVVGSGYDCALKPHAWASSSVADRLIK